MYFRKVQLYDEEDKLVEKTYVELQTDKQNEKMNDNNVEIQTDYVPSDAIKIDDNFFKFVEDIVKRYLNNNLSKFIKTIKPKRLKTNKISVKKKPKQLSTNKILEKSKPIKEIKLNNWIYG